MSKSYRLIVTENQLSLIAQALEFFSRSFSGQLDLWHVAVDGEGLSWNQRKIVEDVFKHVLGLQYNESFGIHSHRIPDDARTTYDMYKVIRHQLWKENESEDKQCSVHAGEPSQYGTEPLMKVEV